MIARRRLVILAWLLVAVPAAGADAAGVRRIVSLAPSITEILFALGVGDRVVGVSSYCDYPAAASSIDRIGTFLDPNVELILAKKADLVIGVPSPGNREPVEALERFGLRVLIVDPERIAAILEAIRTIAKEVGVAERGERLVGSIERRLEAVRVRLEGAPVRKVVMVVGRTPLIAAGTRTYQDELIRLAHGRNVAAETDEMWPQLSIEFVLERAPDVIIDTSMGSEEADAGARREFWSTYPTIPAVKNGRICGGREYELLRPGPRVAESLETMARYIHPERFERKGGRSGRARGRARMATDDGGGPRTGR